MVQRRRQRHEGEGSFRGVAASQTVLAVDGRVRDVLEPGEEASAGELRLRLRQ